MQVNGNTKLSAQDITNINRDSHLEVLNRYNALSDDFQRLQATISSTPSLARLLNIATFFTSVLASTAVTPIINKANKLTGAPKFILASTPLIFSTLLVMPLGKRMDAIDGMRYIKLSRLVSTVALTGLIVISSLSDISEQEAIDGQYILLLLLSGLAGLSTVSYVLISNSIYWSKLENVTYIQSIFSGIGNSALALSQIGLQLTQELIGLPAALTILALIYALSSVMSILFLANPPYHQLKKLGICEEKSRLLAKLLGQEKLPLEEGEHLRSLSLLSLRSLALMIAVVAGFGCFYLASNSLFITLTDVHSFSARDAVLTSSCGTILSIVLRVSTSKLIDKYDRTGGYATIILSILPAAVATLMLANSANVSQLSYIFASVILLYVGLGMVTASTSGLMVTWSKPNNESKPPYDMGAISGRLGFAGGISGVIMPLTSSAFIASQGEEGYFNSFYLMTALLATAAILTTVTHKEVMKTAGESWWSNRWCIFAKSDTIDSDDEYESALSLDS